MKNYIPMKPGGMWGTTAAGKRFYRAEEIDHFINQYGRIWDSMSDTIKQFCKLDSITREGYIRKYLDLYHNIQVEAEDIAKYETQKP